MGGDDTGSAAASRAKSYFLIASIVGNSLTFAVGPRLLDDEEAPDNAEEENKGQDEHPEGDEEHAQPTNASGRTANEQEEHENETTSLLPHNLALRHEAIKKEGEKRWGKLPVMVQDTLVVIVSFLNAPMIGAIVGVIIGLTPPFHKAFFSEPEKGGIFKAWLTASVKNIGELFAALQLVIVSIPARSRR